MNCVPDPAGGPSCGCLEGFDGAADFFDERIGFDAATNTFITLSCPNAVAGTYVVYSIFLLALCCRLCVNALEMQTICSRRREKPLHVKTNMQWRVCVVDSALATPMLMATCMLKLATDEVIGTDVPGACFPRRNRHFG